MTIAEFKKEIKNWLKKTGRNRYWLAQNTYVAKATVDGWLSVRGIIPRIKADKIIELMRISEKKSIPTNGEKDQWKAIGILVPIVHYEILQKAAAVKGVPVEDWCAEFVVRAAMSADSFELVDPEIRYRAAEDPGHYFTPDGI